MQITRIVNDYSANIAAITYVLNGHAIWYGMTIDSVHVDSQHIFKSKQVLMLVKLLGRLETGKLIDIDFTDKYLIEFLELTQCIK